MADGRVEFEIVADGKKASASIDEITEQLRKAGTKWEADAKTSTDQIGSSFGSMVTKIAGVISAAKIGQALLNIGKDAINAASDLQEVQNVVDVTFGDAGAAKIESWAQKACKQFGLTETQAKKFTSTLGAMMKSAGMSGDEIVTMSTDLSGLAADMASFYNLDFDTAFQKIRSGISGETEPLKQLGINMSEANLEAFALQQGLEKTFSEMSQGEKTILRYQYLMNATSDAQGDFANTATGFANSMRTIETNIDSLKTKLGEVLLPVISDVVSGINTMVEKLTGNVDRTVLDDFADIDLQAGKKIAQIEATADTARALTMTLDDIGTEIGKNKTAAGTMLDDVPDGSTGNLKTLTDNLAKLETEANAAKDAAGKIDSSVPDGNKGKIAGLLGNLHNVETAAGTAKDALGTLEEKLPAASQSKAEQLRAKIAEIETKSKDAKKEAEKIDAKDVNGSNVEALEARFKDIGTDIETAQSYAKDILKDLPDGSEGTMQTLLQNLDTLGSELQSAKDNAGEIQITATADVKEATAALQGLETQAGSAATAIEGAVDPSEDAAEKSAEWLKICKQLVETIPGLASIINTETGEIKGGTKAVNDYIDAWEKAQKNGVFQWAVEQKNNALSEKKAELDMKQLDVIVANNRVKTQEQRLAEMRTQMGLPEDYTGQIVHSGFGSQYTQSEKDWNAAIIKLEELKREAKSTSDEFDRQKEAYDEAESAMKDYAETVSDLANDVPEGEWSQETKDAAKTAVAAWAEATQAVTDYYLEVRKATAAQVDSVISGFKEMKTAAQQAAEAAGDYQTYAAALGAAAESEEVWESTIKGKNDQVTLQGMVEGLKSQLAYIEEYQKNLETAQAAGVSDEILSQLSDGSNESALYLQAIAEAVENGQSVEELNTLWQSVNEGKEGFTDALTKQKLAADETYDAMVKKAEEAAKGLDVSETAKTSTEANIQAMADAIKEKVPELAAEIDAVIAQLERLSGWGFTFDFGEFGSFNFSSTVSGNGGNGNGNETVTPHEMGLDFVPYTGYLASLHEGEGILTAEENRIWQNFKSGQNGVDYDALGNVISDNASGGGNVYLNGRLVGSVISDVQGEQYRTLKRSGWQA